MSCQPIDDDDVDVAYERRRVLRGDADSDMLKIENLTKVSFSEHFKQEPKPNMFVSATLDCYVLVW